MCTLQQLKDQNEKEHLKLQGMLDVLGAQVVTSTTVSKHTKWIAGILLAAIMFLLGVVANYSRMTYDAEVARHETEMHSFVAIKQLTDTICAHGKLINSLYDEHFLPTEIRSKENSRILSKHGLK